MQNPRIRIGRYKVSVVTMRKWIDALRSGEYKQNKTQLQNSRGYNFYGVACVLFIPTELQSRDANTAGRPYLTGKTIADQPAAPKWLAAIEGDFQMRNGTALNSPIGGFKDRALELELTYMSGPFYE